MATKQKPVRAGIYARISLDKRKGTDEEGAGVKRQREDCIALADAKGWEVVDVYRDNDVSAYSGKVRPEFSRMVRDIKDGKLDAVVCWHPDRLTRRVKELEDIIGLADRFGVTFANVHGDFDLSTDDGQFTARVLGAAAQKESAGTARRVRRMHDDRRKAGLPHGGGRPYGYRWDDEHRFVVVEEEAKHIRRAVRELLHGRPITRIIAEWNAKGIRTVRCACKHMRDEEPHEHRDTTRDSVEVPGCVRRDCDEGGVWRLSNMKSMLLAPTLSARRAHEASGKLYDGYWEPIISVLDQEKLKRILVDKARSAKYGGPYKGIRLLSGILRCAECGTAMRSDGTGYVCDRSNGGKGCVRVGRETSEEFVVEEALIHWQTVVQPRLQAVRPVNTDEEDALVAERLRLLARRDELAGQYAESVIDLATLKAGQAKLDERVREIEDRLGTILPSGPIAGNLFGGALPVHKPMAELDEVESLRVREFVSSLIDRVEVTKVGKGKRVPFEDRATIKWKQVAA